MFIVSSHLLWCQIQRELWGPALASHHRHKKEKKRTQKSQHRETHKKWKISLGWLLCFLLLDVLELMCLEVVYVSCFFLLRTLVFMSLCVWSAVDCGCTQLLTHGNMHDVCWQEGWTIRWNREILYIVSWQKQIRDMDHNMFFVRKILYIYTYIYISVAAENVKTCPSRDGCRHSGIKFRVARWFQSNFSLQTPPDIQVVVYIEIR